MKNNQIILAVDIGEQLLRNGAEIYRVDESIRRMLMTYNIGSCNVYVVANGIFVSAGENSEHPISAVRHVPLCAMHLERVAILNQLVRDICNKKISAADARTQLNACASLPSNTALVQLICSIVGIGAFTYLFGGRSADILVAIFVGCMQQLCLIASARLKIAKLVQIVIASMLVAMTALLASKIHIPIQHDKVIIGSIMTLLPGVAFANSIRELYNSDYLSGMIHLLDTLVTTLCIAVGIYIPIILMKN